MITPILVGLGLAAGSFVNALVWRIHEQSKPASKRSKSIKDEQLSVISGRSICIHCHQRLAWYDLIPLVSWLSLRGKCRYCHNPISKEYPLVELATAVLFLGSYAFWPNQLSGIGSFDFGVWLILLTGLVALFIYDLKWTILPNRITYPLLGVATFSLLIQATYYQGGHEQLQQAFWAAIVGGGLFYILFQISGGKWIGGGDVKLGALLGLVVGQAELAVLFVMLASFTGSLISVPLLLTHKLKASTKIPFGPLLIAGAVIAKLFGATIVNWYVRQFLFI